MNKSTLALLGAGAGVAASAAAAAAALARRHAEKQPVADGWKSVTVLATPDDIAPGGVVGPPFDRLAEVVETRLLPAPGDRGTELHARVLPGSRAEAVVRRQLGGDPADTLRRALRELKTRVETGEVLQQLPRPEGHRKHTVAGALVDGAERRAFGAGAL